MEAEITDRPAFANIVFKLAPGEHVVAEAGSMASMDPTVKISTHFNGGILRGIANRLFGGESMFINKLRTDEGGTVRLTQSLPGDIECCHLNGTTLFLQPGAFLACEPSVSLKLSFAGIRMMIAREGLFRLKVSGHGRVWFGAYGGIFAREVDGEYIVDSGHLVAYEPSVGVRIGMAGGFFSSFFSGEGLVAKVQGTGRIYMQSRSFSGLTAWTNAHLY